MIKRKERRSIHLGTVDRLEPRRLFATAVGLTSANELVTFDTATPGTASTPVAVTGLGASEDLVGIDFRPATGQLFGLGDTGQLYTINTTTGAATALGSPLTITGTTFGFDFNPTVDRIRIVSDTDDNLRANPNNGALVLADTDLAYDAADANTGANPNVAAAAYTNNFAATGTTTLYDIDTTLDVLVRQGSLNGTPTSPNAGTLFTVGALGVNVNNVGGFDIAESDGIAYAAFGTAGGGGGGGGGSPSTLYTVDLTTGAATSVGAIGNSLVLTDLSVMPTQRTLFALASSGTAFATFNSGSLATNPTATTITGLNGSDTLASIEFRPNTGELIGATAAGQLYTINTTTGAATALGTGFTPALTGNIADIDVNPTVDRIRVITDQDANARANPDTGALVDSDTVTAGTQVDTNLAYAVTDAGNGTNPNVVAAGYTNSVAGATGTTLFALDAQRDFLVTIGSAQGVTPAVSPNGGQLFSVGALGVDVASGGFDIANGGPALALINAVGGTGTQLYAVNTTTGAATLIGTVGDGTQTFSDLAIGQTVFNVSPASQSVAEDVGNATITVTRSGVATGPATVAFDITDPVFPVDSPGVAATAGSDFGTSGTTTFSGTVSFADGETSKTITVPILNDTTDEADETLVVVISDPSVGQIGVAPQATVVITDDDAAPTLSIADSSVSEGDTGTTNGTLTVSLSNASDQQVTVSVASDTTGTATAGTDFTALAPTTLTFAPGETSKTVNISVTGDTAKEPAETVNVALSTPTNATIDDGTATLTITSDDADATVATDPIHTTGKATQVITVNGTAGDDVIVVTGSGANVIVTLNGQPLGTPTPKKGLYRIAIYGGDGNDDIRINSKLALPAEIHGQNGDDLLVGGKSRDLLIGGDGTDALFGRGGEDILIGGVSDYTANPTATATLLNTFYAKGDFTSRANAISTGAGVNNFVFSTNTIDDDTDRDYLEGDGTNDLTFRDTKDVVVDETPKGITQDI